jgi:hypothetical protein
LELKSKIYYDHQDWFIQDAIEPPEYLVGDTVSMSLRANSPNTQAIISYIMYREKKYIYNMITLNGDGDYIQTVISSSKTYLTPSRQILMEKTIHYNHSNLYSKRLNNN